MGSLTLAYAPSALATAFRAGSFSFLSAKLGPVWPEPASVRAGRVVPHLGWKPATRGLLGATRGLVGFVGRLNVGGFPKCRKERKGRKNSARGEGGEFASLARAFPRVQGGNADQCTLQLTHNM